MKISYLIFFLVNSILLFPQQEELITVKGDSLVGKTVEGEMIREVYGNVVLTQGDVIITCNTAIHYMSRNDAQLIGNVIVKQDSLTITTERGFYYGDEKSAESNSGVKLDDQKVILTADTGEYYFENDIAYFQSNVVLFDTLTTLTSNKLTYFRNENWAVAVGNVVINDKENIIEADSLTHFRDSRITFADNNVKITSLTNGTEIFGNHLEDYAQKSYTFINREPMLLQVDTSYVNPPDSLIETGNSDLVMQLDTLIIRASAMEAFRDTMNIFQAADSVRIVRENFASVNNYTVYYKDENKIITRKTGENSEQPVLWYENTQLTGDSVTTNLVDNKIKLIEVNNNAFILSQSEIYQGRYDQISGERIFLYFDEGNISKTEVFDNVRSIYYLYEDETRNGLIKSSAQNAAIIFDQKQVGEVRLYGTPTSEYYPENMISGQEYSYTLPGYVVYKNRPVKKILLKKNSY